MATRTIITSQPDVECDVCARRLLRGEQPDVFIGAGRRRIVCELCAPRAAHEGWMRETDSQALNLPPARPRRGRSFLARLRQVASAPEAGTERERVDAAEALPYDAQAPAAPSTHVHLPVAAQPPSEQWAEQPWSHEPTSFPPSDANGTQTPLGYPVPDPVAVNGDQQALAIGLSETQPAGESSPYLSQALEVFNASEFPRRVAGVVRSLGEPLVNVRSAEHLASVVRIVVAWELCWYRYEVDLSEPTAPAQVIAQGSELAELPREDRLANALATVSGSLQLAGA